MSDGKCKPPDDIRDTWIGRRVLEHAQWFEEDARRHRMIDEEITTLKSNLADANFKLNKVLTGQDNETRAAASDRTSSLDLQKRILTHLDSEKAQRDAWYDNEAKRANFSKRRFEYAQRIFGVLFIIALLLFVNLINKLT